MRNQILYSNSAKEMYISCFGFQFWPFYLRDKLGSIKNWIWRIKTLHKIVKFNKAENEVKIFKFDF